MAELQGRTRAVAQDLEKVAKDRDILLERRRQLEQQHTELRAERLCDAAEDLRQVLASLQLRIVGDAAGSLERERKALGCALAPARQQFLAGHAVERVIDLD